MNKPIKNLDPQLLEYLKALQQPTPNVTALPVNPTWNNHPKLNAMQQKFYQEQQHMMRTEWQLMQEKRQAEERELTQSHGGYGGGGPPKKKTVSPVVPSGISLTAPTIYVSGLSFQNGGYFSNGVLYSPYTLYTPGYWRDAYDVGFVTYSGGQWNFSTYADGEGSGEAAVVATNTAPATSLPTTGWVNTNANLIVTGTLVISTTP